MQKPLSKEDLLSYLAADIQNLAEIDEFYQKNPNFCLNAIAPLDMAKSTDLAFLANPRYHEQLTHTVAGAVLISAAMKDNCPATVLPIVVADPYLAFAKLTAHFVYQPDISKHENTKIHPTAVIADTANIGKNVVIGAYTVIGDNVHVGDNTAIDNHVVLEDFVKIGNHCRLKAHSYVAHHCELGDYVDIHSHASIGNDGFGYAPKGYTDSAGWQKIYQLGRVVIGNHVRIGSQTCIDRGALGDTVIGNHVIIDNLVQIAHNVQIGDGSAIAGCVGIAGSTKIGKRCIIAGGVGIAGHIEICDDVTLSGMTMVTKGISQKGSYSSGIPLMPTANWRRMVAKIRQLVKD